MIVLGECGLADQLWRKTGRTYVLHFDFLLVIVIAVLCTLWRILSLCDFEVLLLLLICLLLDTCFFWIWARRTEVVAGDVASIHSGRLDEYNVVD